MISQSAKNNDISAKAQLQQLQSVLEEIGAFVIAASGGIDSTLLAVIAGRMDNLDVRVFHAVSAAVPPRATERVRRYADSENWDLTVSDTGEFRDQRYMKNPIDRCFYCKSNLYSHITTQLTGQIISGTNVDDLSDYRPGLVAASQHSVRHPYVEANITKSDIRSIARLLNLTDLADLPASPCLSSRMQTGIPINRDWLRAIDRVEIAIQQRLKAQVVRCRIRQDAVVVELDEDALLKIDGNVRGELSELVDHVFPDSLNSTSVTFAPYKMGSAFVAEAS